MKFLLPLFLAAFLVGGCATSSTSAPKDRFLARAQVSGYITRTAETKSLPILHLPDGRATAVISPDYELGHNEEVVMEGQIRMTQSGTEYFLVQKVLVRHPRLVVGGRAPASR